MEKKSKILIKLISNKFFIASAIFIIWVGFFDEHSFMAHNKNLQRLGNLKDEQAYYKNKILSDKQRLKELNAGLNELEKFAREQYNMSKPDEDLFIIVED